MITTTSLQHPTIAKRIRRAFWLCKLQSIKTRQRATEIVKNKRGVSCLTINVLPSGELTVYASGSGMKNYASSILNIIEGI